MQKKQCIICKKEKTIIAKGMCKACYSSQYYASHPDSRTKESLRHKKYYEENKERKKQQNKNWREKNREYIAEYMRAYKKKNQKKIYNQQRLRNILNPKTRIIQSERYRRSKGIAARQLMTDSEKIDILLRNIPELKRLWVKEFLNTAYKEKKLDTKIDFLTNLNKIIDSLRKSDSIKVNSGWNALTNIELEQCQVETLISTDKIRVFFRWLAKRKNIQNNLLKSLPLKKKSVNYLYNYDDRLIKNLYNSWMNGKGSYNERISGLLIIYFGFTVDELRHLKVSAFQKEGCIFISDEYYKLEPLLWKMIKDYLKWREEYYFGMAHEFFFVTDRLIYKKKPVSPNYFSLCFKNAGIPLSPSELRKAMLNFVRKNCPEIDVYKLGFLFRISVNTAAKYLKI